MDKREYNRHIRYFIRQFATFYRSNDISVKDYYIKCEQLEKEFKRLYDLDPAAEHITPSLVIKMVCINRILCVIPFEKFYIHHAI